MTSVKIIASTATVTINGNHVELIGVIASLVEFKVKSVARVVAEVDANLSSIKIPTPRIIPTITRESTIA